MLARLPSAVRPRLFTVSLHSVSPVLRFFRFFSEGSSLSKTVGMEIPMSIDDMFKKMSDMPADKCSHLVRKHYTPEVHAQLKDKKTKLGGTVAHCIWNGVAMPSASMGFLACDPEAYTLFASLTDNIIKDYHRVQGQIQHPAADYGNLESLGFDNLDPSGKIVISTRVRVGRTAAGYPWPPLISDEARNELEAKAEAAFKTLPGDYAGKYYSLKNITPEEQKQMKDDHFLFTDDDEYNRPGGVYRNWPHGRGIYFSNDKTFLSWVNEEDHFRFISMEKGGDLGRVYIRLVKAIKHMESKIPFVRSDRLGNLTFCPTNLGTSLRASVHAKIPKVAANKALFDKLCDQYGIQARGTGGEHTATVGGVYDLSNKRRLGITEFQAVSEMAAGVKAILEQENKL